jgi:hypothetical protein
MAGDWIKMRLDLADDPRVEMISHLMQFDVDLVVGKLHRLWSHASKYTTDGLIRPMTPELLDRKLGAPGITEVLARKDIGWIEILSDGLQIPRWDEHNSDSAKVRAQDAGRKRRIRTSNGLNKGRTDSGQVTDELWTTSGQSPDNFRTKSGPREEKRRKEKIHHQSVAFEEFWILWPRKVAKSAAEKAWKKISPDRELFDRMKETIRIWSASEAWAKDGGAYIPHASTWLNQRRWEDESPNSGSAPNAAEERPFVW